ncbi:MAG TPA: 3'-5' exonuclease [Clostridiales bacterium]|nr:3'-5' exonuclease [Clostridiales bacterium]
MILFFDTETTGLSPGRIIQLSYIMAESGGIRAKNFFFAVEYIEPSAAAVNGFTVEKLAELSRGRTFSCDIDEIYDDFSSADLIVAHNAGFDEKFLIAEFLYQDRRFRYKEDFDTMKYFTPIMKLERTSHRGYKYPKLSEVCEFLDVYPYDVTRASGKIFGDAAVAAHDARYDATALYLCFEEGRKKFEDLQETALKYLQNGREM